MAVIATATLFGWQARVLAVAPLCARCFMHVKCAR